ncbi:hypothetical protein HK405_002971, partial [Cladochytrium tenue]
MLRSGTEGIAAAAAAAATIASAQNADGGAAAGPVRSPTHGDSADGGDGSGTGAMAVNAVAAATWSAADHNAHASSTGDRIRYYGAAEAFEESLYTLPADADEKTRLNMQHIVVRSIFGGNFHTPQRDLFMDEKANAKILDVGCGAGSWAIDMAKQFPHASVTGVDLVSYEHPSLPGNVTLELGNVLEGLKCTKLQSYLIAAGLQEVGGLHRIMPVGWNGPIGNLLASNARKGFHGMKAFFMKSLDVTETQFAKLVDEAMDQC